MRSLWEKQIPYLYIIEQVWKNNLVLNNYIQSYVDDGRV